MKSRALVKKTLEYSSPPRIPRQTSVLPWAEIHHPQALSRLHQEYPDDILVAPDVYTVPLKEKGDRHTRGEYVDEWGCMFSNPLDGIIGIVKTPLIADWQDLESFQPPEEILSLDKEQVNGFCQHSDQYILSATVARPFERLQFIRTMEQALLDLIEQPSELFELLERIHSHYCKAVEVWAKTDVDAISIMDDWGTQQGLLLHPDIFQRIFKPMYRDYVEIAHNYGKVVFMHSDGYIIDIIPDFIEVGITALNSQIFCMGVEELGQRFKGKITFWGEIDRQYLLAHGSKTEIQQAVLQVWQHLYADGGVIAQCEFGLETKPENVFAVFETWGTLGT